MSTFNGHKNWNHWNVALWIGNDEGLYRSAVRMKRMARTVEIAARQFVEELADLGITKTPDGAPYTVTSVTAALRGLG